MLFELLERPLHSQHLITLSTSFESTVIFQTELERNFLILFTW